MACPPGWTNDSTFGEPLEGCPVPTLVGLASICLAGILTLLQLSYFAFCREAARSKQGAPLAILVMTVVANLVMTLRPVLEIALRLRAHSTPWFGLVVHVAAATAASVAVLTVYVQSALLARSMVGRRHCLAWSAPRIAIGLGVTQAALFVAGAVARFWTAALPAYTAFWVPVIAVDFTVIPYFLAVGIAIYSRIRRSTDGYRRGIARRFLLTAVGCSVAGLFTGAVGFVAAVGTPISWLLVELCWAADVMFNGLIFVLFARRKRPSRRVVTPTSVREPSDVAAGAHTPEHTPGHTPGPSPGHSPDHTRTPSYTQTSTETYSQKQASTHAFTQTLIQEVAWVATPPGSSSTRAPAKGFARGATA